jgi:hypothetical protein
MTPSPVGALAGISTSKAEVTDGQPPMNDLMTKKLLPLSYDRPNWQAEERGRTGQVRVLSERRAMRTTGWRRVRERGGGGIPAGWK